VIELVPITLDDAKRFVALHHRHNPDLTGWKVGVGLSNGELRGVAVLATPKARKLAQAEPRTNDTARPEAPLAEEVRVIACACGCGTLIEPRDARGRPRRYASRGHNLSAGGIDNHMRKAGSTNPFQGRTHTAAARAAISESARRPRPHLRGERNGMFGKVGALNPRYVDGSSPERQRAYASAEWHAVVRLVRDRDGHRCRDCGATKEGRRSLHVHHLQSWAGHPDLRFDVDNPILLCATCHRARHRRGG
jgi:hypothetical protein